MGGEPKLEESHVTGVSYPVSFILLSPDFDLRVTSVGDCTAGSSSENTERNPVFLARELREGAPTAWESGGDSLFFWLKGGPSHRVYSSGGSI